ncbi:MAG: sulfotransferase [Gemmatimonadota bacterium]|nr:sulfotransferase [Gemmatimonadota bacterium]
MTWRTRLAKLRNLPVEWRLRRLRRRQRDLLRSLPRIQEALRSIEGRWPSAGARTADRPIFLLAAGWRSGSTLLQRLVSGEERALIWGEAYARCAYVQRLAESLRPFGRHYPPEEYLVSSFESAPGPDEPLSGWIANLFPEASDLKAAHRAFFDRWLGTPASRRGYPRWGLKEVRLTAAHAAYLRWLYPHADIVFLVRDPLDAYRSYREFGVAYGRWPEAVISPAEFGDHWARLASGFAEHARPLRALLVHFEKIERRDRDTLEALEAHLDLDLGRDALEHRVGGTRRGHRPPPDVPALERGALLEALGDVPGRLGYGVE